MRGFRLSKSVRLYFHSTSSMHQGVLLQISNCICLEFNGEEFAKQYFISCQLAPTLRLGLDKICFFFFLFFFSFMLDKSTYFAFPIHPFCFLFHPFCFPKIPFLHTVIKVQAKIRESNEQGCIAT